MTDRSERKVREENEREKRGDAAREEIFVIKSADAAVEKEVMVIAADDAAFAHVAVEGAGGDELSAATAGVSVAGFRLVVGFDGFLFAGHKQRHLVVLLNGLGVSESVQR